MKDNALILVRVSTAQQDLIQQREEVLKKAKSDGYEVKPEYILEDKESAVKLSEEERNGLKNLKELIEKDSSIKCVYTYEVSRISRQQKTLYSIRDFLQVHKVQLVILKPEIKVFDDNWQIETSANFLFSVMSALSENEGFMRKERLARGKKRNAELGKFQGGKNPKFGYKVNENRMIEVDEKDGETIRQIFTLYASGNYSMKKLEKELKSRGIKITWKVIQKILNDESYFGGNSPFSTYERKYPQIISKELFDKCKQIAKKNTTNISKEYKNYYFGNKIIKCVECGNSFICNGKNYRCYKHRNNDGCNNNISISVSNLDGLLWKVSSMLEFDMITDMEDGSINEMEEQIRILEEKKEFSRKEGENYEIKRKRIVDLYADLALTEKEYKSKMEKLNATEKNRKNEILKYDEEINEIKKAIEIIKDKRNNFSLWFDLAKKLDNEDDEKKMSEIVHRQIREITIERKVKDGKEYLHIKLQTRKGVIFEYAYFPKSRVNKMYLIGQNGDFLEDEDNKIIRNNGKCEIIG